MTNTNVVVLALRFLPEKMIELFLLLVIVSAEDPGPRDPGAAVRARENGKTAVKKNRWRKRTEGNNFLTTVFRFSFAPHRLPLGLQGWWAP